MRELRGLTHGINYGGWLSQCEHNKEHFDTFITKADVEKVASWGLDHIRIPFDYMLIQNEDGTMKEEGFVYLDNIYTWCKDNSLRVVLDLHKAKGYDFNDAGTEDNNLFQSKELQNTFKQLWIAMAKRYGDKNDIVAFELLNEIVEENNAKLWNQLVKETVEVIRKFAPTMEIIIGGIRWNNVQSIPSLDPPYDEYMIYNFHCYDPMEFTHQRAGWVDFLKNAPETACTTTKEFFLEHFKEARRIADERNVPLYCGEYGVIDQAPVPDTLKWYQDITNAFDTYHIGRANWSYKEMDFGILDSHYDAIRNELLKTL